MPRLRTSLLSSLGRWQDERRPSRRSEAAGQEAAGKKPPTGRPRGRPPKLDEFLVNSQVRRTLLEILDEEIEIRTPTGTRKVSKFHTVFQNLVTNAAKGNPTSLNHLMRLLIPVLREREQAHPQVWLAEALREMSESSDPDKQISYQQVRAQILAAKKKY